MGLAEDHADLLKLVHLAGAREERLEGVELGHDAAEGEYVNRVIVRSAAQNVLGRSVPSRGHILCEWRRVPYLFNEAEITQLDCCFLLYQHVLRLNVSVEETMAVNIVEC